nr:hypothetical protein [Nanoarchaeum sp.]
MRLGLTGLALVYALSGCASLKDSNVDLLYFNVHKPEIKQVEEVNREVPQWLQEYRQYSGTQSCLKEKEVPSLLGQGVARDLYVFYGQNEDQLEFAYDLYRHDFRVPIVRVRY